MQKNIVEMFCFLCVNIDVEFVLGCDVFLEIDFEFEEFGKGQIKYCYMSYKLMIIMFVIWICFRNSGMVIICMIICKCICYVLYFMYLIVILIYNFK